ncbi:MAG: protein-export chaperone SecB [Alphaproteobacteria bacterium]|nr:protein-export chaperone SecB [Alphaproteobacteria bacterium]
MTKNDTNQTPSVQIISQYIKDLSFEAPNLPHILGDLKSAPAITVDIDVRVNKTDNPKMFSVDLHIKGTAKRPDDNREIFICELLYGALVAADVPAEHLEPVLIVQIPHMLFPYARAIVANITREAGLPPLQINPVDFAMLYHKKLKNQENNKSN